MQRKAVGLQERSFKKLFGNIEANEIVVGIRSVAVLRYLHHIEAKLGTDVGLRIVGVGDSRAVLHSKLWKLDAHDVIDGRMPAVVGGVVRQRSQRVNVLR